MQMPETMTVFAGVDARTAIKRPVWYRTGRTEAVIVEAEILANVGISG